MTKYQALQHFWSSFGIPAYENSTVPDIESRGDFYITYEAVTDSLDNAVPMSASIWKVNTTSWKDVSEVADRISDELIQVKTIPLDIGYLYITRGRPFSQKMSDEDETVRRIYINIMAEYLAP